MNGEKRCQRELEITLSRLGYKGMRKKLFIKRFWRDPESVTDELFMTIKNTNNATKKMTELRWQNNFYYYYEKNEKRWGDTEYDCDEHNKKYPPGHPEHIK